MKPLIAAFFLPQFHPIQENNEWWGAGFTEWTNVASGRPLFRGHDQPRIPGDLGFYDLRLTDTRLEQASLARSHGIDAFCYYHYWFHGRQLLERPVADLLKSPEPDFPFFLCWANEPWTRRWDGESGETLIAQHYSAEDDRAHIESLLPTFADPRYLRVEGRPIFLVYRLSMLPNPTQTAKIWRDTVAAAGLGDLVLARVDSANEPRIDPALQGFDLAVDFAPDWNSFGSPLHRNLLWKIARRTFHRTDGRLVNRVWRYEDVVEWSLERSAPGWDWCPAVCPGWDNSPRKARDAAILIGSTPTLFQQWLSSALARAESSGSNLVFINAWNEWAEGCYLEPCWRWGHQYLDAVAEAAATRST